MPAKIVPGRNALRSISGRKAVENIQLSGQSFAAHVSALANHSHENSVVYKLIYRMSYGHAAYLEQINQLSFGWDPISGDKKSVFDLLNHVASDLKIDRYHTDTSHSRIDIYMSIPPEFYTSRMNQSFYWN